LKKFLFKKTSGISSNFPKEKPRPKLKGMFWLKEIGSGTPGISKNVCISLRAKNFN